MKTRFTRLWRAVIAAMFICLVLLSIVPQSLMAQEGSMPLFLPLVSGGIGQAPTNEEPFVDFDQIAEDELETILMAEASRALPEPAALTAPPDNHAAANDMDADGVPNDADNCPHQPNPPTNGTQPEFCGRGLVAAIDRFVFLHSRIFPPVEGLDPGLKHTQKRERIHLLLHVISNANGVMLSPHQRTNLQGFGVVFLGYLPHNTYYVSLPRNLTTLQQIVALENVHGISALRPKDKVAPQVRVQGPTMGRNPDGTLSFEVDFFDDVPQAQLETLLTQAALTFSHQYDNTYHVTLKNWESLRRLVIQDIVYYVDDLPDKAYSHTQNAQALINGQVVSNTLGLRGNGIVVSMTEPGLAKPITRPEINGRITLGNNPIFERESEEEHARKMSAIMIADETNFPANAGLLPEATLVSFSADGLTRKSQHFGVNKDAHDDYGAMVSNNSWGFLNCSKVGEYHKPGKFFDKAVYEVGIVIVHSAGNARGPFGDFALFDNCQPNLYSLPHGVAKNDIAVGNWDITNGVIQIQSSAGPTADERLKPDLIAPGQDINTINWDETTMQSVITTSGGTSAASAVTSGVVGWLAESFLNQGVLLDSIPPSRYKAILTHTAKDVGPAGPDFMHGYGLIQADRALRISEEWSSWGREGLVDGTVSQVIFEFDVNSPMTFYKATLAWDDKEGEHTSTVALKNDLDLTLISPTGNTFYPYEIVLTGGANNGSVPCLDPSCQDRLNNVEMVMVNPVTDFIEQGTWQAVVDTNRLVSDEQSFSLVLTPPCPMEIDSSVTLTADINCAPTVLEPSGVVIQNDGVELNCDNHVINGQDASVLGFNGAYVGVRVLGNDVTVRDCQISQFDIGIKVGNAITMPTNAILLRNILENNGTIAIELTGFNHLAQDNNISEMLVSTGKGITVRGVDISLLENEFHLARNAGQNNTVAVLVHPFSAFGEINGNTFDGFWETGIRLNTVDVSQPITFFEIDDNTFEGIEEIPISLFGEVSNTDITNNTISIYGNGLPAIRVAASGSLTSENNTISGNSILGRPTFSQFGIQVENTNDTEVSDNILSTVKTAITEKDTKDIVISGNIINPTMPLNNFKTSIGISSVNSGESLEIKDNRIRFSMTGIDVFTPFSLTKGEVTDNRMQVEGVGVSVANATSFIVSGNGIEAGLTAITLQSSPRALISANNINMNSAGAGITVASSNETLVRSNTVAAPTVGIAIAQTEAVSVITNTVINPAVVGIVLDGDASAQVDDNLVNNSPLGIHYQAGVDAVLSNNEVNSLVGGTGIRLGTGAGCPGNVNVDNILVQDNSLTGGALGVEVLCDVGTSTLIGN